MYSHFFKYLFANAINCIIAGVLIGFGCIANLCSPNIIVGSFLFSLGLITVILQKRYLFTGKIGYLNSENFIQTFLSVIFNLIGIGLTCWIFAHYSSLNLNTELLVNTKVNESILEALLKSIGCGAMMYIAVEGYARSKNLITVILPVMLFIICGFDHCIANYGYMCINNTYFCWNLPIWTIGNAIGSLIISKTILD